MTNVGGDEDEDVDTDAVSDEQAVVGDGDPPSITETDIRMIAANLHDQGLGHVLVGMVEAVTGVRPPEDTYSPRKMPIRDPDHRAARQRLKRQKHRAERRARMTDGEKAKEIGNLQLWKANNPEKMQAAETRRLEKKKEARQSRIPVAVDIEGFNTGRFFTDDRPNYQRDWHEKIAHGLGTYEQGQKELDDLLKYHILNQRGRAPGSANPVRGMDTA